MTSIGGASWRTKGKIRKRAERRASCGRWDATFFSAASRCCRSRSSCSSFIILSIYARRSTALIIVFLVCLLVYIGRKLRRRERSLLSLLEQLVITKIPVIGGWYATFRDILQTFTASGGSSYLGTVKIPVGKGYVIAFVSKREVMPDGTARVTVFVPTSPNPTTGFVLFFDERDIEYLDIPPEKAFTLIISLGVKS